MSFGTRVLIVDPATRQQCADGRVGEIWVESPSVAGGYWRRETETRETFHARLAGGDGPFLRTGDLGALHDGELFVAGRLKDVLIVRGFKHYPQDIEHTAERQHAAIRPGCSAAFSIDGDDGEAVAIALEVDRRQAPQLDDPAERDAFLASLIDRVRAADRGSSRHCAVGGERAVARRDAKDVERQASSPRVSRRVRRWFARRDRALGRRPGVGESARDGPSGEEPRAIRAERRRVGNRHVTTSVASRGDLRDRLAATIGATLRVNPARIGPFDSFASLGMDSLAAVELTAAIEDELGIELSLTRRPRTPEPRRALPVHRRRRRG